MFKQLEGGGDGERKLSREKGERERGGEAQTREGGRKRREKRKTKTKTYAHRRVAFTGTKTSTEGYAERPGEVRKTPGSGRAGCAPQRWRK